MASYSLGGHTYPMKTVAQCKTCASPHRMEIEQQIIKGRTYRRILEEVQHLDPDSDLSVHSLKTHFERGHMPMETEVVRRTLERRARERGQPMDEAAETVVDGVGFAQVVLAKTLEGIASSKTTPTVADGLAAAKLIEQFGDADQASTEADYVEAFIVYYETVQAMMTEEQFEQFGRRLASNPTLRRLMTKHASQQGEDEGEDDFYGQDAAIEGEMTDSKQS